MGRLTAYLTSATGVIIALVGFLSAIGALGEKGHNDYVQFISWINAGMNPPKEGDSPTIPNPSTKSGRPATMVTLGQQHVFYRGDDGVIDHIWFNESDRSFSHDQWKG
jgi:hypothetical protein